MPAPAVDFVERTGGVFVELPPGAGSVGVARLLAHTLAQRRDLDEERIEDLVLAVSEACSIGSVTGEAPPVGVTLRWSEEPDRCVIEVGCPGGPILSGRSLDPPTDPGAAAVEGRLHLPLIAALVDELEVNDESLVLTVLCGPWQGFEAD